MEIKVVTGNIVQTSSDAMVLNYFEDEGGVEGNLAAVDRALDGAISQLINRGEIKGKFKETCSIFTLGKLPVSRVLVVGLGKKSELNPEKIRVTIADTCKALRQKSLERVCSIAHGVDIPGLDTEVIGQAIAEGALLGTYTFRRYFSKAPDYKEIQEMSIVIEDESRLEALARGCQKGRIIAEAAILARDMSNEPANVMTPSAMAEISGDIARKYNLGITIIEREEMQRLGMGGLLGVAQGSQQPPKFIVLKYRGRDSDETDIALVGKGITFDSGGISIKPSEGMGEMKGDMAGGAAVIGAISAIVQLKPSVNVASIVPATENMPGGAALRPGDIVKFMNGKTAEIISTDAEGRLILADALSYAGKIGAKRIVDVATLTGACHIALGDYCTGTLGNNQKFIEQIISAGAQAGECLWQLPMNEEYRELIKSDVADIKNTGGRYGGAITAAWFLREFVNSTPWVHLDIAGTSTTDKDRGYLIRGNTGVPVRTLINLVLDLAKS
jgi:leucyl aminopeptidase